MDNRQGETIRTMRSSGFSCARISAAVGLPLGTVKAFCSRNGIKPERAREEGLCGLCRKPLVCIPNKKPRRFCSDACRLEWWKLNRDLRRSKGALRRCAFCGKEYASYEASSRFCSHPCYISSRFGKGGESNGS